MKLWIGGELDSSVADAFREARSVVSKAINAALAGVHYDIELNDWDCIAILRDDAEFKEITAYSRKKRDMDFRLKIDYSTFKNSSQNKREAMIYDMLERSLSILKEKGVSPDGLAKLGADIRFVAKQEAWVA